MAHSIRLYEFGPTRSLRARWMLQEIGCEFDSTEISLVKGEHLTPEFLKLNPAAKLPVLVDDDLVLTESIAIALYLAEKFPDRNLMPTDLRGRAESYRWLLFVATELEQALWRIAKHTVLYPEEKRLPAEIELARQDFVEMAAVLEAQLQGREYLVGKSFSVVDVIAAYTLDWANEEGLLESFPAQKSYMERMYQRPAAAMRISAAMASVGL